MYAPCALLTYTGYKITAAWRSEKFAPRCAVWTLRHWQWGRCWRVSLRRKLLPVPPRLAPPCSGLRSFLFVVVCFVFWQLFSFSFIVIQQVSLYAQHGAGVAGKLGWVRRGPSSGPFSLTVVHVGSRFSWSAAGSRRITSVFRTLGRLLSDCQTGPNTRAWNWRPLVVWPQAVLIAPHTGPVVAVSLKSSPLAVFWKRLELSHGSSSPHAVLLG